jgi:hypothetical protein
MEYHRKNMCDFSQIFLLILLVHLHGTCTKSLCAYDMSRLPALLLRRAEKGRGND